MKKFKVPVDFTVYAENKTQLMLHIDLFLKQCYRDVAPGYNVIDYELPVGYPAEET